MTKEQKERYLERQRKKRGLTIDQVKEKIKKERELIDNPEVKKI